MPDAYLCIAQRTTNLYSINSCTGTNLQNATNCTNKRLNCKLYDLSSCYINQIKLNIFFKKSVIITVLNGAKWIDGCMKSIINQTAVIKCQTNTVSEAQTPLVSKTMTSPTTSLLPAKNNSNDDMAFAQLPKQATSIVRGSSESQPKVVLSVEICVFEDCSCDNTYDLLCSWQRTLRESYKIPMIILRNNTGLPKGGMYNE